METDPEDSKRKGRREGEAVCLAPAAPDIWRLHLEDDGRLQERDQQLDGVGHIRKIHHLRGGVNVARRDGQDAGRDASGTI